LKLHKPEDWRIRLYNPKISIYDHGFEPDDFGAAAGKSAPANLNTMLAGSLPPAIFHVIKAHLEKLSNGTIFTTYTQAARRWLLLVLLELIVAHFAAQIFFDPDMRKQFADFLQSFIP